MTEQERDPVAEVQARMQTSGARLEMQVAKQMRAEATHVTADRRYPDLDGGLREIDVVAHYLHPSGTAGRIELVLAIECKGKSWPAWVLMMNGRQLPSTDEAMLEVLPHNLQALSGLRGTWDSSLLHLDVDVPSAYRWPPPRRSQKTRRTLTRPTCRLWEPRTRCSPTSVPPSRGTSASSSPWWSLVLRS